MSDIDNVLVQLADPDAGVRQLALIELEWTLSDRGEDVLAALILRVKDEDPTVRALAIARLEDLGDARAVPAIVDALSDQEAKVREAALTALREFRTLEGATALLPGIGHPSAEVREAVIIALRDHRDARAIGPLVEATADQSAQVRREAVITLAHLRSPESIEALRARLRDPESAVRRVAVGALDFFNSPALVPDFIEALSDQDWQVRREAAIVLGRSKVTQAVPPLLAALGDSYWQVRKEAILGLGKLGALAAENPLIALLEDESPDIRKAAAQALGELRSEKAVSALPRLVTDADSEVRKAARHALDAIRAALLVCIAMIAILSLGACKKGDAQAEGPTVRLTIGTQDPTISTASGGLLVRELGLLDKYLPHDGKYAHAHYDISWKTYTSGPPITTDMVAGKVDIGLMGDFPSVANAEAFRKLGKRSLYTAIVSGSVTGGGNAVLVPADSSVESLADLKGKTISVPFGSSAHGTLLRAIRDLGWDPERDVSLISQTPEVGGTALRGHKIDAHADFVPYTELFPFRKYARKIYDGSTAKVPTSVGVVVSEGFGKQYPELVVAFLKATLEGDLLFTEDPEKYSELVQKVAGVEAEVVYMFQGPLGIQTRDFSLKPEYREGLRTAVATFAQLKKDVAVDVDAFVDDHFIRQAAKELGLDYDARLARYTPTPLTAHDAATGREITDFKSAVQVWVKDEPKVRAYADIEGALAALAELAATGKTARAVYVHDRNSGSKLLAEFAYYTRSQTEVSAFLLKKDAEAWAHAHPGTSVVRYPELQVPHEPKRPAEAEGRSEPQAVAR